MRRMSAARVTSWPLMRSRTARTLYADMRQYLSTARVPSRSLAFTPGAAGPAATDDELVGLLVPGPGPALGLAPRRDGVAAARALAFASTQGVVDGIHGHAPGLGPYAPPPVPARLADGNQLGLGVA